MNKAEAKVRNAQIKVPSNLKNLRRLLLADANAIPHIEPYTPDPKWLQTNYKGDEQLFTMVVYIVRKCWKSFLETCKYDYYHQKDKNGTIAQKIDLHQLKKKSILIPNAVFVCKDNKLKAKLLLKEYDKYRKNLPPKVWDEWKALTPTPWPWKQIPHHIHPSQREIKAEKLYTKGDLAGAKKIMNRVQRPKSTQPTGD